MQKSDSNENESVAMVETPKHVVEALSRLGTLSYQHRQMLKEGDVLSLLEQFVAAGRSSDWVQICGIVGFGANFVLGLPVGQLTWISSLIAATCLFSYRTQKQLISDVTRTVHQFTNAQDYTAPTQETQLLTELRLHYSLLYQQKQRLKAGETIAVAKEMATSNRRNGWFQLIFMTIAPLPHVLTIFMDSGSTLTGTGPTGLTFFFAVMNALFPIGFGIWAARTQFRKARRLEELVGLHPTEMWALTMGAKTNTDDDSPYRSPQFR